MGWPFNMPAPLVLIVIAVIIAVVISAGRRNAGPFGRVLGRRQCPGCRGDNPGHANYCRRCGRKL